MVTKSFPKEETFGLLSQMRSCGEPPANIAEGSARKNGPGRKQFYYISRASLSELETHILISRRLGYLSQDVYIRFMAFSSRIAAMLNEMIKK